MGNTTHQSTDRQNDGRRPAPNDLKVKGGEHSRRGGSLSRRHKNLFLNNFLINNHRFSELNRGCTYHVFTFNVAHCTTHNGGRGIAEIGNVIILIINIYLENQNWGWIGPKNPPPKIRTVLRYRVTQIKFTVCISEIVLFCKERRTSKGKNTLITNLEKSNLLKKRNVFVWDTVPNLRKQRERWGRVSMCVSQGLKTYNGYSFGFVRGISLEKINYFLISRRHNTVWK